MTALVADAQFKSASTTAPSYKTKTVVHESGVPLTYSFCGDCSSVLWKTAESGWPGHHIIFAGTLDDEGVLENMKPDAELWNKYRVPWMKGMGEDGVMQCQGFPEN